MANLTSLEEKVVDTLANCPTAFIHKGWADSSYYLVDGDKWQKLPARFFDIHKLSLQKVSNNAEYEHWKLGDA